MNGKTAPLWPKILAVVCSIALAAGYVGWRKHQADKAAEQAAKQAEAVKELHLMVGSKSPGRDVITSLESLGEDVIIIDDPSDLEELGMDRTLMSSSKSGPAITLDDDQIQELLRQAQEAGNLEGSPEVGETPRTLMPSSKVISGLFKPEAEPETEPEEEDKEEP